MVFHVILAVGPVTFFYAYLEPIFSTWTYNTNLYYKTVQYILWIGNLFIYGVPVVLGALSWLWNAYINAGYMAWAEWLILWLGTVWQGVNFVQMIIAAFVYQTVADEVDSLGKTIVRDNVDQEFSDIAIWAVTTAGIYAGYWLLNDNFLTYYVIGEINHSTTTEDVAASA